MESSASYDKFSYLSHQFRVLEAEIGGNDDILQTALAQNGRRKARNVREESGEYIPPSQLCKHMDVYPRGAAQYGGSLPLQATSQLNVVAVKSSWEWKEKKYAWPTNIPCFRELCRLSSAADGGIWEVMDVKRDNNSHI